MSTRDTVYSEATTKQSTSPSVLAQNVLKLPPEVDNSGNVEYKTKLADATSARITHLTTQLQWRLAEGDGCAIYIVGVHDDGEVVGITQAEFDTTIDILKMMINQLGNAQLESVRKRVLDGTDRVVAEVRITQHANNTRAELRIAVLGEHDSGKSTILGYLTYGEMDNGRGKARLNLLRHRHEIESGHTSSITFGSIGFDSNGVLLNYANNRSAEQLSQRSKWVTTFIDTCGHSKHLKTTMTAITGFAPQAILITIAADISDISDAVNRYLVIAAVLKFPVMIAVTKMDLSSKDNFSAIMIKLLKVLSASAPDRGQFVISGEVDYDSLAKDFVEMKVIPIFTMSAVNGTGMHEFTSFCSCLCPGSSQNINTGLSTHVPFEFCIEDWFLVDTVGTVVTGWVKAGTAGIDNDTNTRLVIGPDSSGNFIQVRISSIHTLRMPTRTANSGTSAALAIRTSEPINMRKGMLILSADDTSDCTKYISNEALVNVTILSESFKPTMMVIMHIRSCYHQTSILSATDQAGIDIQLDQTTILSKGTHVTFHLRFTNNICEYMYHGIPVIARDGQSLVFAGHIIDVV